MGDAGLQVAERLIADTRDALAQERDVSAENAYRILQRQIQTRMISTEPFELERPRLLTVAFVIGVNGAGKTTTIGKLANYYRNQDKRVVVAAADTYRAAAIGFLLGSAFICAWLYQSGLSLPVMAVFLAFLFILYFGTTKVIAETGVVFLDLPVNAHQISVLTIGSGNISGSSLTSLGLASAYARNWRGLGMGSVVLADRLTDGLIPVKRPTPVSPQPAGGPPDVAYRHGIVQAELLADVGHHLLRFLRADTVTHILQAADVGAGHVTGGQLNDDEGDDRDHDQRRDHHQNPAADVGEHRPPRCKRGEGVVNLRGCPVVSRRLRACTGC
jgi:hypothetical protein